MTKTGLFTLIIILFALTFKGYCQGPVPVTDYIDQLENRYKIQFSYLDSLIENRTIDPADLEDQTTQLLYLESILGHKIKSLGVNRFIITSEIIGPFLCGTVSDLESGEAIPGVTVRGNSIAVTNQAGFFRIKADSLGSLLLRGISYDDSVYSENVLSLEKLNPLRLKMKTTVLPTITIKDYLSRGINRAQDGSLLLRVEPLITLPGLTESDLLHSLQFLPGIQSSDETVSDLNIRGGTNDQNLIMLNGVRLYQSGHFFGLISAINPEGVKEARLIKNGTSAQYGDAVSGSILMSTSDQRSDTLSVKIGISMLYSDLAADLPVGRKGGLFLSFRRSLGDLVNTPTYSSYYERAFRETQVINSSPNANALANSDESFYFYDLYFQYVHRLRNRGKLKIFGTGFFNKLEFTENAVINNITESRKSNLSQESRLGGISLSNWWNKRFFTEALASVSAYELGATNVNLFEDQVLIQENSVLDYQLKLTGRYLFKRSDLLFGYQFNNLGAENLTEANNPAFRERIKRVSSPNALFIEDFRQFGKYELRTGLRANYFYGIKKWSLEPRFLLARSLSTDFKIELTGEMKSQLLIQRIDLQTDFLGVEKKKWYLPDLPNNPLVKSRQLALGMEYKHRSLLIHVEGFWKEVENIQAFSQGFLNQFRDSNSRGNYIHRGIDILLNNRMGSTNVYMSYTYSENENIFPEFVPSSFPGNQDTPHKLSLGFNYEGPRFIYSSGVNWRSGRPYTSAELSNNLLVFAEPNSERTPNYMRTDLSIHYKFLWKKAPSQFSLSIWNIFNRENITNTWYTSRAGNLLTEERTALPLTVNARWRTRF